MKKRITDEQILIRAITGNGKFLQLNMELVNILGISEAALLTYVLDRIEYFISLSKIDKVEDGVIIYRQELLDKFGLTPHIQRKIENSLSEKGIFVTVDLESVAFKQIRNKRIKSYMASVTTEKLDFLREQIEAGKIKSVLEKVFPLSQVADAHRYYEKGHLKGKVVITLKE